MNTWMDASELQKQEWNMIIKDVWSKSDVTYCTHVWFIKEYYKSNI
jgi:hypothetical protein